MITGLRLAAVLLLAFGAACDRAPAPRLFVLGIDGMDPVILRRLMDAGRMPNFSALARRGGMSTLATTMPPQSPVAWSSFITGLPPQGHGIFDFVHRDTADLSLFLSTSHVDDAGQMALHRRGTPFWDVLLQAGIPATIFRVPANFPPSPEPAGVDWTCRCALRAFAGMGTPDLLGTYGTFTLFTDGDYEVPATIDGAGDLLIPGGRLEVPGGRVQSVHLLRGSAPLVLDGPEVEGVERRVEGRIFVDPAADALHLNLPGADLVLRAGEWTPWVELDFDGISGITRFYLRGTQPLWLYAAPLNLHPQEPLMPISVPASAAADLAQTGLYYTQGMPADTKALESEAFDEGEFLQQLELTLAERERHLDVELRRFDEGLLFFYVHSLDQISHMLWRAADATHPGHRADLLPWAGAIDAHYERMDALLGRALEGLQRNGSPPAEILVLSDHGFASYARSVNLNRLLVDEGFLVLADDAASPAQLLSPKDINWSETRAYALGLNALYLNRKGREPHGIVTPAEVAGVRDELARALQGVTDPGDGTPVIQQLYDVSLSQVAMPPEVAMVAPDLLVGYWPGYRSSGGSAIGRIDASWIQDNLSAWSGDHCMAADAVPGVLLSSRPFVGTAPALWDIPVSILDYYSQDRTIEPPTGMAGRSIWRQEARHGVVESN